MTVIDDHYHFVAVRACGPQSWGTSSYQEIRDTQLYPTKSGIVGAIANAAAVDAHTRHGEDLIRSIAAGRMFVRVDCPPRETVNHGMSQKVPHDNGEKPRDLLWQRHEILNGCYLVLLGYDDYETASIVSGIVTKPQRVIYMGRKCFPAPTGFGLGLVPYGSFVSAANSIDPCPIAAHSEGTRVVCEVPPSPDATEVKDQPTGNKTYSPRYVKTVELSHQ